MLFFCLVFFSWKTATSQISEFYYNQALEYLKQGKNDSAIVMFTESIRLDSSSSGAFSNRSVVYFNLKMYEEAIRDVDRAIQLDSQNELAYNNKAWFLHQKGDYKGALINYNKAITIDSVYLSCYLNRGLLKQQIKLLSESEKDFKIALQINPENAAAFNLLGKTYFLIELKLKLESAYI